jgi:hypothetical protein
MIKGWTLLDASITAIVMLLGILALLARAIYLAWR